MVLLKEADEYDSSHARVIKKNYASYLTKYIETDNKLGKRIFGSIKDILKKEFFRVVRALGEHYDVDINAIMVKFDDSVFENAISNATKAWMTIAGAGAYIGVTFGVVAATGGIGTGIGLGVATAGIGFAVMGIAALVTLVVLANWDRDV